MKTPITVGIAGLGRAGWELHLKPLFQSADFKIVAVADPLPERCQEAAEMTGCATFASLEGMLADSPAQLIVVATPSSAHYADTLAVLNEGRHCITEKPLAMEIEEAEQLVALAEENNLGLFVHHILLHRPEFYHLQEVIGSGVLGNIFHLRAFWGNYVRRWDWQTLKKNGGGQLYNICPHVLSMLLPMLGKNPRLLSAELRNVKGVGDAEDHVHLVLEADSGISADIVVSTAVSIPGPRWMICGDAGTLVSDGETSRLRYFDPAMASPLEIHDGAAPGRQPLSEDPVWIEKSLPVASGPIPSFHENIHAVLTQQAEPIVTPSSALEVMRIIDLAREFAAPPALRESRQAVAV